MGLVEVATGVFTLLWGYIIPFLFVLTIVVFVHEMGHFLVGRLCGVGVRSFSIGFGPQLFGFTDKKGTRWKISAIPLGGYVKFAGDANGASVPDRAAINAMNADERALSFYHKSVLRRTAIVAAGPVANFCLAILIFTLSAYLSGREVLIPRVEAVQVASPAERAGFEARDLVISIDNQPIAGFDQIQRIVSANDGQQLSFQVERKGQLLTLQVTPEIREMSTPLGKHRVGVVGLQAPNNPEDWTHQTYGFMDSLNMGVSDTWYVVDRTYDYIKKLVTGRESTDQLSGPIRIAQVSGYVAASGIGALISLAGLLSVSVGLINLVPVPVLDGGHLLYYAIEAVRGRPLSERTQEMGFRIGIALVLGLMVFVTWNDISHLMQSFRSV